MQPARKHQVRDDDMLHADILKRQRREDACGDIVAGAHDADICLGSSEMAEDAGSTSITDSSLCDR